MQPCLITGSIACLQRVASSKSVCILQIPGSFYCPSFPHWPPRVPQFQLSLLSLPYLIPPALNSTHPQSTYIDMFYGWFRTSLACNTTVKLKSPSMLSQNTRESLLELTLFPIFTCEGSCLLHGWAVMAKWRSMAKPWGQQGHCVLVLSKWWVRHSLSMPTGNASNKSLSSEDAEMLYLPQPSREALIGMFYCVPLFYCVHQTSLCLWDRGLHLHDKGPKHITDPFLLYVLCSSDFGRTADQQLNVGKCVQPYFLFSWQCEGEP